MKKVLIITYYWPPAGGPGVQRVLKFVKYLPAFGWQPIILTVKSGSYPSIDKTLEREVSPQTKVYKTNSWEPDKLYKSFVGIDQNNNIPTAVLSEKNLNWKKRFSAWVRLNFFIPDAKVGWIPFAVHKGRKIIKEEQPDLIFSTSPPPSVHLIAKKLQKASGLKWLADFRDPWTDIHYYEDKNRSQIAQKLDKNKELKILDNADKITCISQKDIDLDFGNKTNPQKCINIPNGYDENDFKEINLINKKRATFLMTHLGAVGEERIPVTLFEALKLLESKNIISENTFELQFIGKVEAGLKEAAKNAGVSAYITYVSYLPHRQAIQRAAEADALLLLITQSNKNVRILPGKTFEYIRMLKPILGLGPEEGEVADILKTTKNGIVIEYKNRDAIFEYLKTLVTKRIVLDQDMDQIKKFDRKNLTARLANEFNNLLASNN